MRRDNWNQRKRRSKRKMIYWMEVGCMAALLIVIYINQAKIMNWLHSGNHQGPTIVQSNQNEHVIEENTHEKEEVVEMAATGQQKSQASKETEKKQEQAEPTADEAALRKRDKQEQRTQIWNQEIHGAYYSALRVSSKEKVQALIQQMRNSEINAVVIDLKDDTGFITYETANPLAKSIKAARPVIWNIQEMVDLFHQNGIYVIGRVVAFRDSILPVKDSSYAICRRNGSVFHDRAKDTWLNPYNKDTWEYLLDIGEEAIQFGVDEIQFDYVRFSTEAKAKDVKFGVDSTQYTKTQVITDFVAYAADRIHKQGGKISADVFGTIITSSVDAKIVGQDYVELSKHLDYICPMIYPSHYADGCYGLEVPDLQPYELIVGVLNDSVQNLLAINENQHCAKVRPWLQDFTASWKKKHMKYGKEEVQEQIKGVNDSGYSQWLLWNSSGRYSMLK